MKPVYGIMPTRGRREMAARAVECFLAQDYGAKALLIRDDDDDPSFPDGVASDSVAYSRGPRLNIPQKLNILCGLAPKDSILCRFDSDDWSAPERISTQVKMMEESGKPVAGFSSIVFVRESSREAWIYRGRSSYALGTSMCFTKEYWLAHRWLETRTIGSDNAFGAEAERSSAIVTAPGVGLIIARVHKDNTSPKRCSNWKPTAYPEIMELAAV